MASVRVFSGAVVGLEAFPVEVEVDATPGLHWFNIVGLADKAVQESKDRIAAALKNSGFSPPKQKNRRIIVNLAPADLKKEGPAYDLPIALGYLLATEQIKFDPRGRACFGELSLDGSVRRVNGILPAVFMAKQHGFKELIVPQANVKEAAVVNGLAVTGVQTLKQLAAHLTGQAVITPAAALDYRSMLAAEMAETEDTLDLSEIKGQETAKRALLLAAAGGHNLLLYGPPGTGKTLLARALAGILPPLDYEEALEVTKIYSVCGLLAEQALLTARPFRSPHHTTSAVAVIGGGGWPKPGEISLAHRGVLFLDELPEFPRNVLEALRQPLESGSVTVARAAHTIKFPARFLLVAAMNPCPCGNYGSAVKACLCTGQAVANYQKKISGPILDRIDMQVAVPPETQAFLGVSAAGPTSADYRQRVSRARKIQRVRFAGNALLTNATLGPKEIKKYCRLEPAAEAVIKQAVLTHQLSGRSYHKLLKLARTVADLEGHALISEGDMAEAIGHRIKQENSGAIGEAI